MTRGQIETRHLRYFHVVAEELHFGRAAERLHISQPSLSQQIRDLERHVGVKLFERSTRRVELTVAGVAFKTHAKDVLSKIDEAVLSAQRASGEAVDQLKIGAISPAVHTFMPMVLRRFRVRYPETRLELRSLYSPQVVTALEQGDVHLGVLRTLRNPGILRFTPLLRERFIAVIPKQHRLASRKRLTLADFAGEVVVELDRSELSGFDELNGLLRQIGAVVNRNAIVSNTMSAMAFAAAGSGIAFLPEWVRALGGMDVVTRNVEDLDIAIDLGIAWRADDPAIGIQPFLDMARMTAQAMGRLVE